MDGLNYNWPALKNAEGTLGPPILHTRRRQLVKASTVLLMHGNVFQRAANTPC